MFLHRSMFVLAVCLYSITLSTPESSIALIESGVMPETYELFVGFVTSTFGGVPCLILIYSLSGLLFWVDFFVMYTLYPRALNCWASSCDIGLPDSILTIPLYLLSNLPIAIFAMDATNIMINSAVPLFAPNILYTICYRAPLRFLP